MDYHPGISVFRSCPSSIPRNAASHTRILGRSPKSPSYTYRPAVRASNVAALPRAGRVLGHTLVSKLGLQHRHAALSTRSSVFLVVGFQMLVVCSNGSARIDVVILHMFDLFCMTLHCRNSEAATKLWLRWILGIDAGICRSSAGNIGLLYLANDCVVHGLFTV
jgi:hypothetical protein